ncbi:MAG: hypothetical protein LBM76_00650 [Mycoplasmataceae bacterium]|nr:hypothetical protein [Mycoplasmataceae bacterium]
MAKENKKKWRDEVTAKVNPLVFISILLGIIGCVGILTGALLHKGTAVWVGGIVCIVLSILMYLVYMSGILSNVRNNIEILDEQLSLKKARQDVEKAAAKKGVDEYATDDPIDVEVVDSKKDTKTKKPKVKRSKKNSKKD